MLLGVYRSWWWSRWRLFVLFLPAEALWSWVLWTSSIQVFVSALLSYLSVICIPLRNKTRDACLCIVLYLVLLIYKNQNVCFIWSQHRTFFFCAAFVCGWSVLCCWEILILLISLCGCENKVVLNGSVYTDWVKWFLYSFQHSCTFIFFVCNAEK